MCYLQRPIGLGHYHLRIKIPEVRAGVLREEWAQRWVFGNPLGMPGGSLSTIFLLQEEGRISASVERVVALRWIVP